MIGYTEGAMFNLVDGHRRYAAGQIAGVSNFPGLVYPVSMIEALYKDGNVEKRQLNGDDWLNVFLSNPRMVADKWLDKIESYEQRFGRELLELAAAKGKGIEPFNRAITFAGVYNRALDLDFVADVLRWSLETEMTTWVAKVPNQVSLIGPAAWNVAFPIERVEAAIASNQPITMPKLLAS